MTEGPIIQGNAVVFLRARVLGPEGRDRAAENHSLERQRERCKLAAENLGARIVKEYVEHTGTGPVAFRPVLREMLETIGELAVHENVRFVLAASLDRLSRQPGHLQTITDVIQAAGARLLITEDWPGGDLSELGIPAPATSTIQPQLKGGSW